MDNFGSFAVAKFVPYAPHFSIPRAGGRQKIRCFSRPSVDLPRRNQQGDDPAHPGAEDSKALKRSGNATLPRP
eukprot:3538105-Amphidinium_carterae.2